MDACVSVSGKRSAFKETSVYVCGGMCLRRSYLVRMFLSRQCVHCHAKAGMPMLLCQESGKLQLFHLICVLIRVHFYLWLLIKFELCSRAAAIHRRHRLRRL